MASYPAYPSHLSGTEHTFKPSPNHIGTSQAPVVFSFIENRTYDSSTTSSECKDDAEAFVSESPPQEQLAASQPQKRVPRPRNAFMIFRSAFWADEKISRTVEHDHRHISRIIGHCWNKMSEVEKDEWRAKALQEKLEHERKYPGYRFQPTPRTKRPLKRRVKRNGLDDLARCEKLADLLLSGKTGDELSAAIIEDKSTVSPPTADQLAASSPTFSVAQPLQREVEEPPFRSPLLPPLTLSDESSSSTSSSPSPTTETYHYAIGVFPPVPESVPVPSPHYSNPNSPYHAAIYDKRTSSRLPQPPIVPSQISPYELQTMQRFSRFGPNPILVAETSSSYSAYAHGDAPSYPTMAQSADCMHFAGGIDLVNNVANPSHWDLRYPMM